MKELISIAFMIVCGIIAYGFFSSKVSATEMLGKVPMSATRPLYECYGNVPASGNVIINLGTTTNTSIGCTGDSGNAASLVMTSVNSSDLCGSGMVAIGEYYYYTPSDYSCNCRHDTQWGWWCCGHNNVAATYTCSLICAPITTTTTVTATAPQSNCAWK